jgi:hypothetical protein
LAVFILDLVISQGYPRCATRYDRDKTHVKTIIQRYPKWSLTPEGFGKNPEFRMNLSGIPDG